MCDNDWLATPDHGWLLRLLLLLVLPGGELVGLGLWRRPSLPSRPDAHQKRGRGERDTEAAHHSSAEQVKTAQNTKFPFLTLYLINV